MKSHWSTQFGKHCLLILSVVAVAALSVPNHAYAQETEATQNETSGKVAEEAAEKVADKAADRAAEKAAKKKIPKRVSKTMTPAEGYAPTEMFAAMESGDIKVELIPKDATQANIFVTNNTAGALAVEMPEAFVLSLIHI